MKNFTAFFKGFNNIVVYVLALTVLYSCNRTFKDEDDLKHWLSGKEFSSQNADYDTYDIYGKTSKHSQKLVIRFDGDKVQYENCLSAPYDIVKKSDDYEIIFKVPCLDEYLTMVIKADGKISTKSVIYDSEYAYNRNEYVENRPNGISKLDALAKLERKEVTGPDLILLRENIAISDVGVDTTTTVKNFRNDQVNWGLQRRIQARLDSDYANVVTEQPAVTPQDNTTEATTGNTGADSVLLIEPTLQGDNIIGFHVTDKLPQSYCAQTMKFTFFKENGTIKVNCYDGTELYHTYTCNLSDTKLAVEDGQAYFYVSHGVLYVRYPDKLIKYALSMCR